MLASPASIHPWPEPTLASASLGQASPSILARQVVADQGAVAAAKNTCQVASGNEVISCFPTANTVITQHEWATFVWNSNNPDFAQTNRVDIYLFHGDSLQQVLKMANHVNPRGQAGSVTAQVDDTWWGTRGADWAGSNISYPFYWLIARSGESLSDGTLQPQATFSAVQTTFADSVIATRTSTGTSATSATITTSISGALTTVIQSTVTVSVGSGSLQSNASNAPFPHWAIIVIVLGIVAAVAIIACMLFTISYIRKRDRLENGRHPIRSSSPDMEEQPVAPVPVVAGRASSVASRGHVHDSQRALSPAQRTVSPDSAHEPKPFSGTDAAIMAHAFRSALRSSGRPLEEEERSAVSTSRAQSPEHGRVEAEQEALLMRQLGDEGTGIRSVGSARGVRVESSSDGHEARFSREYSV
ncbi:hypothetical protein C8R43DRAFT_191236 [Mycena crocata]|nr:hypothetical protein C8R43DRAFT_191236 [Mycena crocata]